MNHQNQGWQTIGILFGRERHKSEPTQGVVVIKMDAATKKKEIMKLNNMLTILNNSSQGRITVHYYFTYC